MERCFKTSVNLELQLVGCFVSPHFPQQRSESFPFIILTGVRSLSMHTTEQIRTKKEILCTHQLEKEHMLGSWSLLLLLLNDYVESIRMLLFKDKHQ